jgi:hypothetical protein
VRVLPRLHLNANQRRSLALCLNDADRFAAYVEEVVNARTATPLLAPNRPPSGPRRWYGRVFERLRRRAVS